MLALAIPLAIFILPALAKHLHCSLDPVEIWDAAVSPSAFVESDKPRKRGRKSDENADRRHALSMREPEPNHSETAIVSMEGKEADDKPDPSDVETMDEANEHEESGDRADPDAMIVESPSDTSENEPNGILNAPMPPASKTPSPGPESGRNSNSKVASLRAAFEQTDRLGEEAKRKFTSGGSNSPKNAEDGKEYESEIKRLKGELEREKDLRIAYEEKVTSLEDEIEELNTQLEAQEETWREEYEQRRLHERTEVEERMSAMANEARSQKLEANTLQKQLVELKRSVSTSTRTSTQVSDTTFRQEIGTLRHEVQNWVVNSFRRVKVDSSVDELCSKLEKSAESSRLELLKKIYRGFDPAAKLPIYQATVACFLTEVFEDPYLYGLPKELAWVERSREAAETLRTVLPPVVYNRWRAVTFDSLRQLQDVEELVGNAAFNVAQKINNTLNAVTESEADEARLTSLKTIVKRVIEIAHLMHVQQAQYEFSLPAPGDRFDAASMDDISEDSDVEVECTVLCATFPSIVKLGDQNGDHLDMKNLIVKAHVLCNDDET